MGEPMTIDEALRVADAAAIVAKDEERMTPFRGFADALTTLAAEVERLTRERDAAMANTHTMVAALDDLASANAERDRLAAALAEVREAADALVECVDAIDGDALRYGLGPALDAADTVRNLASIPADLAAAHDARVRAEALREAAPRVGKECRSGHEAETWLRAEAERIGGGR